jgi:uncharacterized protein (DUF2141 family)
MAICRVFFVGLLLAVVAPAQQPSSTSAPPEPTYKLEGKVVKEQGKWIQNYPPQIVDSTNKVLFTAHFFDAQTGAFAFNPLPAGTYTVRVGGMMEADPELNATVFTTHKIVVAGDVTDMELALHPGLIPVMVRKESEVPLGRCWWNPLAEMSNSADCSDTRAAQVQLVPIDSRRTPYTSGAGILKDPTQFRMVGIEPGKYAVQVQLPFFPGNYVQSVRSGNLDLLHEYLVVPEYGSVLPIEVVVRDDFGFIKVQGNEGVRRSVIVVLREGVLLSAPEIPIHFNEEDFSFPVAPGSYAVLAFDSTNKDYSDPEFLSKYSERAVHVTVSAKETRTVNLDVIHIED